MITQTNLNDLAANIRVWADRKGWSDTSTVGEDIALMHSELSEALEEYRNHKEPYEIYRAMGNDKPEGIPIELADVIIRILHFCARYDIDIDKALEIKLAYNETRTYKHGGKRF